MLERMEHPRADADDHVGLAPKLAAERERYAQRIAAVEHAASAPIGEHRRLQHRGKCRHLGGCFLSATAADDHRTLGAAEQFCRRPHRVLVDRRVARRERRLRRAGPRPAPHVDRTFQHRGPAPPRGHRRDGLCHQGGGLRRRVDAGGEIHQTCDNAGLIADFMQVTDPAPDVGMGNLPDQPEHRRVHRISGQERRASVEQARTRHDHIGRRTAGRDRGAERHVGRALLMARMHHADAVGRREQGVEQPVIVHARQRVNGADAMGDQRGDYRLGRGDCAHEGHRLGSAQLRRSIPRCRGGEARVWRPATQRGGYGYLLSAVFRHYR